MIVYSLTDPNNMILRYIGISKHTAIERFRIHLKDAKTKERKHEYLSTKEKWLLKLYHSKQQPIVATLFDNLSENEAISKEAELIAKYGRIFEGGTLYNVQEGGYYDSCKATVWNKGLHGCYSKEFLENNKLKQPNSKAIYRFTKEGEFIDKWNSIRDMCRCLNLDRRAVVRCLKHEENFVSHKGFMFNYTKDAPVYLNKSTLRTYSNSPHAKQIIAIIDDKRIEFSSIKEASEKLKTNSSCISSVLHEKRKKANGYIFKFK